MRQQTGWLLREIDGIPHLIPYGQNIADQKKGVRLNSTGALLWNALDDHKNLTSEELYEQLKLSCEFPAGEEDEIKKDVKQFLQSLIQLGILTDDTCKNETYYKTLEIGGLILKLYGRKMMFPSEFLPFEKQILDEKSAALSIHVHNAIPPVKRNGTVVMRNKELILMKEDSGYVFLFPNMKHIYEVYQTEDGQRADFYCIGQVGDELRDELFHAIRFIYLYRAQMEGIFAIHSVSVLYEKKAWLFSASSGTGKSTHAELWREQFHTPVINGDLNLMKIEDGKPIVLGLPWCGTSGICDTRDYPLGGIVLLERAGEDWVEELTDGEKSRFVAQRLISPMWTTAQMRQCLDFTEQLSHLCYVTKLHCTKEPNAAVTMKEAIDRRHPSPDEA